MIGKWLLVAGTALACSVSFCIATDWLAASNECGPVNDTRIISPNGQNAAHLMNQYCSPGFGIGVNPFWVVVGDNVAKAGEENPVTLGQESDVAFKTWDYEPEIFWKTDDNLVVLIRSPSTIAKSLHTIGRVNISYRISENLIEENFLKGQALNKSRMLEDIKNPDDLEGILDNNLKHYKMFNDWAKENVE